MNIGSFGFPADQLVKLEKILKLSKNNRYLLTEFDSNNLPDLLLVFGIENIDAEAIAALPRGYQSRLIIVSKDETHGYRPFPPGLPACLFPRCSHPGPDDLRERGVQHRGFRDRSRR